MIVARIRGRLGNQLFQYAMARTLALEHGTELRLDLTHFLFEEYECRLPVFKTQFRIAGLSEIGPGVLGSHLARAVGRSGANGLMSKLDLGLVQTFEDDRTYVRERPKFVGYDEASAKKIAGSTGDLYLDGFWQSEKWFQSRRDSILKELKLRTEPPTVMREWMELMSVKGSVALHVRRGDYAQSGISNIYGVCDAAYYKRAEEAILARVERPRVFVFSDDLAWAKDNLKLKSEFTLVESGPLEEYHELVLMSCCENNIISNSTFSWWGAYLNRNPGKVVVAPARWLKEGSGMEEKDAVPEAWTRI